jgi:hypothetical protein
MNNNVLNKISEVESIIKQIKDNLKIKKDTEKDKQLQVLLLQKEKYDKQNKEFIQLKKIKNEKINTNINYIKIK